MISENLRHNFNVTIGVIISTSALLLLITLTNSLGLLAFDHNSILVLLFGILILIKGVTIKSLVRHLHDQIDTYYKSQKMVHLIGQIAAVMVIISGIIAIPVWAFTTISNATENSNFLTFYVQIILSVAFITLGIWIFNINRSLRFLNLISYASSVIGYLFALASILIPISVLLMLFLGYTSTFLFLSYVMIFGLAISWYSTLYSCLTK